MLLELPKRFDLNEWIVILCILIQLTLFIRLPKRLPTHITILIMTFTLFLTETADAFIATNTYNLYDWMDSSHFELFDLLTYLFEYPLMAYFFLYFYDKWNIKGLRLIAYVLAWTTFSASFEWMNVICHVLVYKGWKLLFSVPVYLTVFGLELLFYRFVRTYNQKHPD